MSPTMKNALTIDLEDWFCVYNLRDAIPYERWDACELRVEAVTDRLLGLLRRHSIKATFFVLGWIAERCPGLIKAIAGEGHEIACHGYSHRLVYNLSKSEFEKELVDTLAVVQPLAQHPVIGFRAPSFSVKASAEWVFSTLRERGFLYDSSIFPVGFHPDYANGGEPLEPHPTSAGIIEFPLSCFRFAGIRVPCCGGGYFRLLPYSIIRFGIRRCNKEGRPAIFYLHPWELDPAQPRVKLPAIRAFRHYLNLEKTERRLERLLNDFSWTTVRDVLGLDRPTSNKGEC
jgi:polysaccharide deacetylase family protein (PEP-CTERM system associated)